jgi:hypothetical protein
VSCHPYPMSTSFHNQSAPELIEFELTPEQTEVLLRTVLPVSQATPPDRETIAIESDVVPRPTSQERSPGSHAQSTRPLHNGRVGLVVRVLLHVGLFVGIAYARQIGEEPVQAARKVDPKPALVGEERAPAALSTGSEPMRIRNPFDRTESFEFPPGTSEAEAREAVTKVLMERAHDRLPLLAEASRRRGTTAKHGTHESSQLQDGQYRNSQAASGRGPG